MKRKNKFYYNIFDKNWLSIKELKFNQCVKYINSICHGIHTLLNAGRFRSRDICLNSTSFCWLLCCFFYFQYNASKTMYPNEFYKRKNTSMELPCKSFAHSVKNKKHQLNNEWEAGIEEAFILVQK